MKSLIEKVKNWTKLHQKLSSAILIAVVIIGLGSIKIFGSKPLATKYVIASVEKGNILSTVSGSGQVSASDQVNLSAKASGELVSLNVSAGQSVRKGAIIAQIDSSNAYYDFETAKLTYDKLVTVDPDNLRNDQNAVTNAQRTLDDSYLNARTSISNTSTDMSNVLDGLNAIYDCKTGSLSPCKGYSQSDIKKQIREKGQASLDIASSKYQDFITKYQSLSGDSSNEDIEKIISDAYDTALSVAQSAKYTEDAIVYFRNHYDNPSDQSSADSAYSTVVPLVSNANSALSSITSLKTSLTNNKTALDNATIALQKLKDGPDPLDLRSSELSVRQKQDTLSNYTIRAPFDGIIAAVSGKKGDSVNNGTSVATLITQKKIAEISLNEIDVAKIQVGQKVTLTFDALEDLTITGEVVEVDSIGTVSQGVVNYKVKIGFDVDDIRVKPGMSVSASIVTDMKQNVLVVPISAVKTQGGESYIEVVNDNVASSQDQTAGVVLSSLPDKVAVETGISSDDSIEIISGINEGEKYVVRTITSASAAKTPTGSAPSLLGGGGSVRTGAAGRSGGGNFVPR